jgi:lipopolysaccharide/colanic/teichoic acid biosynthesis glycosyltransferase
MSEQQVSDDAQRAFRLLMVVIGVVVAGMLLLIAVVTVYRNNHGGPFPYNQTTPAVASPRPSAS